MDERSMYASEHTKDTKKRYTIPRLYPKVRPEAIYTHSLSLIQQAGATGSQIQTKSGLMLGMGETPDETRQTLKDLRYAGCRILTLGQYLQPFSDQLPVERFIPPDELRMEN